MHSEEYFIAYAKLSIIFSKIVRCACGLSSFCAFYLCGVCSEVSYLQNEDVITSFAQILVLCGLLATHSWAELGGNENIQIS